MSEQINLPYGFKRVEWLRSNGTQFIDTGYVPNNETGLYVEAESDSGTAQFSIGMADTNFSGSKQFYANRVSTMYSAGWGSTSLYPIATSDSTYYYAHYISELNYYNSRNNTLRIQDKSFVVNLPGELNFTPIRSLYIFAANYPDNTQYKHIGRIWRVKITQGDELVRDYIPCLDTNNRPCLYDIVQSDSEPLYNLGGGDEFEYHLKYILPKKYIRLNYLEDTGSQWIDTEYIPTNKTGLYVDAQQMTYIDSVPMGSKNDSGNTRFFAPRWLKTTSGTCGYGWGSWASWGSVGDGRRFEGFINFYNDRHAKLSIGDKLMKRTSSALSNLSFTPNKSIYIFGYNNGGTSANSPWKGRIYSAKITEDNDLVRHFVPAYDTEKQKPCMYDLIKGEVYYNRGSSTDFNFDSFPGFYTEYGQLGCIGNRLGMSNKTWELPPGLSPVEYIDATKEIEHESNIMTNNIEVEADIQFIYGGNGETAKQTFSLIRSTSYDSHYGLSRLVIGAPNYSGFGLVMVTDSGNTTYFPTGQINAVNVVNSKYSSKVPNSRTRRQYRIYDLGYKVNGVFYQFEPNIIKNENWGKMKLFCVPGNKGSHWRVWKLKVKQNGEVIANLIPCIRDIDGVKGFWCSIYNKFYEQ